MTQTLEIDKHDLRVDSSRRGEISPPISQLDLVENRLAQQLSHVRIQGGRQVLQSDSKCVQRQVRHPFVNDRKLVRPPVLSQRNETKHHHTSLILGQPNTNTEPCTSEQPRPRLRVPVHDLSLEVKLGTNNLPSTTTRLRQILQAKTSVKPNHVNRHRPNSAKIKSNILKDRKMSRRYGSPSNPARPVGFQEDQPRPVANDGATSETERHNSSSATESSNPQRLDGFTRIPPNQRRRDQIKSQAEREAQAYQSYKEGRRVNYVQTTPQIAGGSKSHEDTIKQLQREQRENKYRMINKRKQWEREKKEREEAEYREKKEKAREQTRRNEQRRAARQNAWTDDHVRTNEQWLRKLEQQQQSKGGSSSHSSYRRDGRDGPWSVD